MYIFGSEEDGVLHGWLRAGPVELFLWFENGQLVDAQVTAHRDVAEWSRPARLRTGTLSESRETGSKAYPGSGVIDFDRKLDPGRVQKLLDAVRGSQLWPTARALAQELLNGRAPSDGGATVEDGVRVAMKTTGRL